MTANPSHPRFYLELPAGDGAAARLGAALAAADIDAVLIRRAAAPALDAGTARPLVELAQARGAAALIEADARLARTLRADGVHLRWSADLAETFAGALEVLGGRAIIGASAGPLRHDAMTLGEAGAAYVGFDLANASAVERLEQVGWWAEIFEIPCVALGVTTPEEAIELTRAGADFIGIEVPAAEAIEATASRVRAIVEAARRASTAPPPATLRGAR